ncbi:hypothetical protein [Staphylococcus warneri]|uniref:Uncharacterized protein n=1 Tax=Staphylococcus warneri TaxID=1292 RepID=A0AB36BIN7_STAWA|nr:hypothetical protein [Staphylococcus warneri]NBH31614.1 hypothetical protein [Staphylococcus warneri]
MNEEAIREYEYNATELQQSLVKLKYEVEGYVYNDQYEKANMLYRLSDVKTKYVIYKGLFEHHDKALSEELEAPVIKSIEAYILQDFENYILQNVEDKVFVKNTILQSIEEAISGIPKQVFFK